MKNEIFFLLEKKEKAGNECDNSQESGNRRHLPRREGCVVDGIAETLHEIIKRIPEKEGPEPFRKDVQGVEDGSQKEECLKKNCQNLLDILNFDLHDGGYQRGTQREKEMKEQNDGKPEQAPCEL